jgi:hypothetical protein
VTVATDFQTVTPSVFAWHAYEPAVKCELSSCAIETAHGLVLVDPIELAAEALARLLHGRTPHAIVLTNGNHTRAAEKFRTALGVKIFAPRDADGLEVTPDATLSDGQIAFGDIRILSLPGAGPGEIALVGQGVACLGDALIHLPPDDLRILPDKYCTDPAQLRRSLRKLLSCDFQVMTFAHGVPLTDSPRTKLEPLIA